MAEVTGTRGRGPLATRARGERGSVLVEAAFITPVLFFLLFSILEFGMAFRDYLAVANTTRDGARAASIYGNDLTADFDILQTIADASNVIDRRDIERIVIYEASGPNAVVPSTCANGTPVQGTCNVYTAAALDLAESEFGCRGDRNLDRFWCPTTRKTALTGTNGPPDYVGVWIQVKHIWVTGLFGPSLTFTDSTVMRMEPEGTQ